MPNPPMSKIDFSENNNIGDDVIIIRNLLSMTQEQLAKCLHISRVTLSKIERSDNSDIGEQDLFRIYYLCQEIIDNKQLPNYIREKANQLKDRIKLIL